MPKNQKKKKKSSSETISKRELILAEDMQFYAKVTKLLGDCRIMVLFSDSTEIMGVIPGRMRKRVWMSIGDVVLVSKREFQEDRVDIIHKYTQDEIPRLHKMEEIPSFFMDKEATHDINDDINLEFKFDINSSYEDINIDLL